MQTWAWILAGIFLATVAASAVLLLWIRHLGFTAAEGLTELKSIGVDLVRLPGRLRALSRDSRVPRSVRWMILALAIYIVSPIDLIPDFLPGIGHLDEFILVPFFLREIRRRVPEEVWREYMPSRQPMGGKTRADRSGSGISGSSG